MKNCPLFHTDPTEEVDGTCEMVKEGCPYVKKKAEGKEEGKTEGKTEGGKAEFRWETPDDVGK